MEKRMMNVHGVQTLVTFTGQGKPLLCLHGWGASYESFTQIREAIDSKKFQVIAPDFPGFGESADPPKPWSVDDYADFTEDLVRQLHLTGVLLLGHSFGGRVSIKLASRHVPWIHHMYLCASAGVRHPKYFKRTVGIFLAEAGNQIFSIPGLSQGKNVARNLLYKILRVHDYEKASGVVRETMIKVINEDLTPLLEKVEVPTDLFWGENDRITPLKDGKLMNTKIAQSQFHTYPNIRHGVHRYCAKEIVQIIEVQMP